MNIHALLQWRYRHRVDPRVIILGLGVTLGIILITLNYLQPVIIRLLPNAILLGLFIGSIYALVALGYTMVYGILKFINFAHGEVFMWGGYFVYTFSVLGGVNFFIGCFVAVMLTTLMGILIERIGYRPLRRAPRLAPLITAIGFSLFLQSLAVYCFKADYRSISAPIGGVDAISSPVRLTLPSAPILSGIGIGVFALCYVFLHLRKRKNPERKPSTMVENLILLFLVLFSIFFVLSILNTPAADPASIFRSSVLLSIQLIDGIFLVTAVIVMIILHLIVKYTTLGKAMRAVSDDMDSASAVGIDVDRVIASTFALGSLVAGIGGILFGLKYCIYPYMGFLPGLKAFAAAVVGGIGNIYGAMIGGLIIGMAEQVGPVGLDMAGISGTPYQDAIVFIVLIIFLIIKPSGVMGKEHLVMSRGK